MIFESVILNLFILLALIIALIFDYVTKFFSYWYIRHVPYKSAIPIFGSDYHRVLGLRNTTNEVQKLYNQYPEDKFVGCIRSRIPDLIVKDPDAVRKILSTDFSNFHCRGLGLDKSRDVCLRNNLFYSEGEKWTLLRKELETLLKNMNSEIRDDLHVCLSGINGDTNVQQLLSELLDIVFKDLLIGNNIEGSIITCLRKQSGQRSFQDKIKWYLKNIFPSLHVILGINTAISQLYDKFLSVICETKLYKDIKRREMVSEEKINTKSKKKDTDDTYTFSVLGLFITEGYLPCHNILTSLLYELARNVQVQERVRSNNEQLVLAIKETLRLHPPYSVISRKCIKMYTFADDDFLVDRGVTITVPLAAIHRDENNFNDAVSFKPERFENNDDVVAFMPFGQGPRSCVGADLAMKIITTVSSLIVNNFHIDVCNMTPTELRMIDEDFGQNIENDVWLKLRPINSNKI
ncbi:cytochrome P450 6a8 [Pieris rapae]|uniref:cytochrome P450 6a8 n=1 Tax=Pieris rapae TaxID=64459 RepID=UPI001E27E1F0|nr:cytochrome P450 6a8 [Pieris rapae]XP_022123370.2 cytochrome P450 6a8 [Pieris rapae]